MPSWLIITYFSIGAVLALLQAVECGGDYGDGWLAQAIFILWPLALTITLIMLWAEWAHRRAANAPQAVRSPQHPDKLEVKDE